MPSAAVPAAAPEADDPSVDLIRRLQKAVPGGADHARLATELVNRYVRRLAGFLQKRVTNPTDAEDILFIVLAEVIKSVRRYNPDKGRPFGWTCGIARNRIIDFFRRPANRPAGEYIDYSGFDRADAGAELDAIIERDRWETAEEAVRAVTNPRHWDCYDRLTNRNEAPEAVGADLGFPALTCVSYRNRVGRKVEEEFHRLGAEEGGRP